MIGPSFELGQIMGLGLADRLRCIGRDRVERFIIKFVNDCLDVAIVFEHFVMMDFALAAGFLPLEGDRHSDVELFSVIHLGLENLFLVFFQESDVLLVNFDRPSFVSVVLFGHKLLVSLFPLLLLAQGSRFHGVHHISI